MTFASAIRQGSMAAENAMKIRKITRFEWNFRGAGSVGIQAGIKVETIAPANRPWPDNLYRLNTVKVALFPDARNGCILIDAQYGNGFCLDKDLAAREVAELLRGHIKDCDGVVVTPFNTIRIDLSARPGKKFTETAMDLCLDIFNVLGIKRVPAPLVGQFTQIQTYAHGWLDYGEVLAARRIAARR